MNKRLNIEPITRSKNGTSIGEAVAIDTDITYTVGNAANTAEAAYVMYDSTGKVIEHDNIDNLSTEGWVDSDDVMYQNLANRLGVNIVD